MIYLIIDAEEGGTGVRNEFGSWVEPIELDLPPELTNLLLTWIRDYENINHNRSRFSKIELQRQYEQLDKTGIDIAQKIASQNLNNIKIAYYYSDGLQKRIYLTY